MYQHAFQAQIWPLISRLLDEQLSSLVNDRIYYQTVSIDKPTFPLLTYGSTDNGGTNKDTMSTNGWEGEVFIRCGHTTLSGAWSILTDVITALSGNVFMVQSEHLTGDIEIAFYGNKAQPFPNARLGDRNIYTVGIVFHVDITPE